MAEVAEEAVAAKKIAPIPSYYREIDDSGEHDSEKIFGWWVKRMWAKLSSILSEMLKKERPGSYKHDRVVSYELAEVLDECIHVFGFVRGRELTAQEEIQLDAKVIARLLLTNHRELIQAAATRLLGVAPEHLNTIERRVLHEMVELDVDFAD